MKTTFSSHYVTQDCNNTTWKVSYRGPVFALLDLHNSQRPAIVPKEQHHRVIEDRRDMGKSLRSTFLGDTCSCTLIIQFSRRQQHGVHSHLTFQLHYGQKGRSQQQKKWATLCTLILLHEITELLKHLCTEAPRR